MTASVHRPKPRKLSTRRVVPSKGKSTTYNPTQFGFFLAGIIDSDGHFNKIPQLVISFHEKERHAPYYLKKEIGYGLVSKVKGKRAATFVMAHSLGLDKVCQLIHNKLQHRDKIDQYNTRLISLPHFKISKGTISIPVNQREEVFSLEENAWLAGLFFGDGCFQIKILNGKRGKRQLVSPEVRMVVQIDQKEDYLLSEIRRVFGGYYGFRKSQDTFYYISTSFRAAERIIKYFDRFHLIGVKLTQYVLWRKVFVKIRAKNYKHTPLSLKWIASVKERMSLLSS